MSFLVYQCFLQVMHDERLTYRDAFATMGVILGVTLCAVASVGGDVRGANNVSDEMVGCRIIGPKIIEK